MVNQKKKSFLFGLLGAATAAGMVMGATGVISTFVEKPTEANAAVGDKYVRLTEMPEEGLSGEYLIVCMSDGFVFNGALDPIDVDPNTIKFDSIGASSIGARPSLRQHSTSSLMGMDIRLKLPMGHSFITLDLAIVLPLVEPRKKTPLPSMVRMWTSSTMAAL